MPRYSEVKIFRPKRETTRRDLFVSTHAGFAVDIFGTDGFPDTRAVNAKRSKRLHSYRKQHSEL
jgi:hypothetical protein